MGYAALTIAKYFLSLHDKDSGELISNLKLQKLLYYAQGYYVALKGRGNTLFAEKIYAWKHGPVVKAVYNHYASYKDGALPSEKSPPSLDDSTKNFLNEIYSAYGRYSAWALGEITHREGPWLNNYKPAILDIEIPVSDLHAYFVKNVKKETSRKNT